MKRSNLRCLSFWPLALLALGGCSLIVDGRIEPAEERVMTCVGVLDPAACVPVDPAAVGRYVCVNEECVPGSCLGLEQGVGPFSAGSPCEPTEPGLPDGRYFCACPDGGGGCTQPELSCQRSVCGDGYLDDAERGGVEVCDDGNTVDGDGCDSDCLPCQFDEDCTAVPPGASPECVSLHCDPALAACSVETASLNTMGCGFVATASCCAGVCDPTANGFCDVVTTP